MKKLFIITLGLFLSMTTIHTMAQEMQYLFQGEDKDISLSGFAGVMNEFSEFDGDFAFSMGGGAALLIDQRFYIGGYGMGLTTRHLRSFETYEPELAETEHLKDVYTRFGHGGIWLGFILNPQKAVNFGANVKLGWGSYSITDKKYPGEEYKWENYAIDNVFVFSPEIDVNLNLLKWMRLSIGVGYRLVSGVNETYLALDQGAIYERQYFDSDALNSLTGNLSLSFGWFNK